MHTNLLNFATYEDYLDSFIGNDDIRYMRNWTVSRKLVQENCKRVRMDQLLSRENFEDKRRQQEAAALPRGFNDVSIFGENYDGNDRVLQEIAKRELLLKNKKISTIFFLLTRSKQGLEISSYIDLEQSLRTARQSRNPNYANWKAIFEGKEKLKPRTHHLSYLDWYKNLVLHNDSDNFRVVQEGAHSLLMMHRGDHKFICVNAGCHCLYSYNARRTIIKSRIHGFSIFFDHFVRRSN